VPEGSSLDEVEIVSSGPRFVFGVSPGGWGVWDRQRPDTPVALFASTDEGMEQAERTFEGLDREDRMSRGRWSRPLLVVMFVSLGVWVVARAGAAVLLSMVYSSRSFTNVRVVGYAQILDESSGFFFAVWIAALVVFVALWLQRNRLAIDRLTAPFAPVTGTPPDRSDPSPPTDTGASEDPSQWAPPATDAT